MTATANIEEHVTEWIACKDGPWYPTHTHGGFSAYRIHQQFDGIRWLQRHEWLRADGSTEIEGWISGAAGWASPRAAA